MKSLFVIGLALIAISAHANTVEKDRIISSRVIKVSECALFETHTYAYGWTSNAAFLVTEEIKTASWLEDKKGKMIEGTYSENETLSTRKVPNAYYSSAVEAGRLVNLKEAQKVSENNSMVRCNFAKSTFEASIPQ